MKPRELVVVCGCIGMSSVGADSAQTLSTYGSPGLIDMPTARVLTDGQVALTANVFGNIARNTFTFPVLPRVHGSFRYGVVRDFSANRPITNIGLFDRSFDVHVQLAFEAETRPALALGLRDFGGTGFLAGEYLVATKSLGDRFTDTGGLARGCWRF